MRGSAKTDTMLGAMTRACQIGQRAQLSRGAERMRGMSHKGNWAENLSTEKEICP